MRHVATSTVAMTVYNVLAGGSGARTADEIMRSVIHRWACDSRIAVGEPQIREAIGELVRRGFVRELGKGFYDVRDTKRRLVIMRNRTGDGWSGWRVTALAPHMSGMVRLEDVTK